MFPPLPHNPAASLIPFEAGLQSERSAHSRGHLFPKDFAMAVSSASPIAFIFIKIFGVFRRISFLLELPYFAFMFFRLSRAARITDIAILGARLPPQRSPNPSRLIQSA